MKGKTDHTIRKSKYEHLVDLAIIKNISGKFYMFKYKLNYVSASALEKHLSRNNH